MSWTSIVEKFKQRNPLSSSRHAFVIGATGQVGKCLVNQLLASKAFDKLTVITRRSLNYTGPNSELLVEKIINDFDDLEKDESTVAGWLADCQYGFCSLGTTKAKAGSPEAFRKVDHDYIVSIGKLAKQSNCKWFGLVSSVGASSTSYFLYPQTKGETENDMIDLKFSNLSIFRPALLQCDRGEDSRALERIANWLAPTMNFISAGRAAIPVEAVATAMIIDALFETSNEEEEVNNENLAKVKIVDNKAMLEIVKVSGLIQ